MIKHASTAQELPPKEGKVSGQAWNADHKLGVGYMAPIAVGEFQIGVASASFFDSAATRVGVGHYTASAPYQLESFLAAAVNGWAKVHFVFVPHTPLASGWYIDSDASEAGNATTPPVVAVRVRDNTDTLADPAGTIRGQLICYAVSDSEPA